MSGSAVGERELVASLARHLADRHVRTVRALDRLDALDGRTGPIASEELRTDASAADDLARELVARLLRIAADGRLEPILRALALRGAAPTKELAARVGVSRLALLRRVDELVDAGLAERDVNTDVVGAAPLGLALVELIDDCAAATAAALRKALP